MYLKGGKMADINNWWSRLTDFKRWRFSTKITFIVALISGIVLSLFFIGTQFYYNDTVENQMRDALLAQTKSVAEEIDHILGERIAVSAVRADSPVFSTVARTMSALSQQEKEAHTNSHGINRRICQTPMRNLSTSKVGLASSPA